MLILLSLVHLFATPWPIAFQALLSMEFSSHEYWSGQPFLSPGDLLNPGTEPWSPALEGDSLSTEPPGISYYFIHEYFRMNLFKKCLIIYRFPCPLVFSPFVCWWNHVIYPGNSHIWSFYWLQPMVPLTMCLSVQFSHSVVSDSLWPHGLQHARLLCPSPTPGVCSDTCQSRWYHPTISSSVIPFSSRPQSFPASGSFPVSQYFASGGQNIRVSALASVLPMNIQDWFPLGLTGLISLQSQGLSRVFSNTTVQPVVRLSGLIEFKSNFLGQKHWRGGAVVPLHLRGSTWCLVGSLLTVFAVCVKAIHWPWQSLPMLRTISCARLGLSGMRQLSASHLKDLTVSSERRRLIR